MQFQNVIQSYTHLQECGLSQSSASGGQRLSFLACNLLWPTLDCVDLFTHSSKLSEFIQSDVPSNTLLLIRNEFGTVFKLGIQRLETLEQLEIQYLQALAKPERETF